MGSQKKHNPLTVELHPVPSRSQFHRSFKSHPDVTYDDPDDIAADRYAPENRNTRHKDGITLFQKKKNMVAPEGTHTLGTFPPPSPPLGPLPYRAHNNNSAGGLKILMPRVKINQRPFKTILHPSPHLNKKTKEKQYLPATVGSKQQQQQRHQHVGGRRADLGEGGQITAIPR